ncbi:MAG: acyl-CoA dehydrogenase family protein [Calditrichaeota bacterium]|nr:acyl-CoA dehydrogenase family protein [Candidatus Cloacimonadota bacterium]MCB1045672.1 acyl-CoA dehydrogenase family protein [Calditrichota bacterium]MCB9472535.1 acyl-CoA dehydrogenase family protein [Candidatus Delongbacteria bacterium]
MPTRFSHLTATGSGPAPLAPEALDDSQREFRQTLCQFASEQLAPRRADLENFDLALTRQLLDQCAELGLCAVDIPEAHGGLELGWITAVASSEYLAECRSASLMVSLGAVTGIGLLPILLYGTEEQKARWLPGVASGELKGAYALTEPGSGSDALAASSRAVVDGEHWVITGRKQYITNAGFADYFIVFAQARSSEGQGFSAFFVPRDTPGLSIGLEEHKMGLKGSSTAPLILEEVRVPLDHLIGQVGEGTAIALVTLDLGRLKLGLMDLGLSRVCIRDTVRYTGERRQFGTAIANFEALQGKLAAMGSRLLALESMAWRVLGLLADGMGTGDARLHGREAAVVLESLALESSMVKIHGSESLFRISDAGLQSLGGYGFIEEYGLAGIFRDNRVDRIFEGTNEINRQVIVGNLLRAALEGQLTLRNGDRETPALPGDPPGLAPALDVLHRVRRAFCTLLDAAITAWGQDLALRQLAGEDLADLATTVFALDSACLRVRHWHREFKDPHCVMHALGLLACESLAEARHCAARLRAGLGDAGAIADEALTALDVHRDAQLNPYALSRALAHSLAQHGGWPEGR